MREDERDSRSGNGASAKEGKNSVTLGGYNLPFILQLILGTAMIGVSIYLTKHFFEVRYSDDLTTGAICDFSQFFSCDKATLSPLSNLFGVPTSVFGLMMGVFYVGSCLFPSKNVEQTNAFLSRVNAFLCLCLFAYSLIVLKGLCLMCTIYYLLSLCMMLLYWKWYKGPYLRPALKVLGLYGLMLVLVSGIFSYQVHAKQTRQEAIAKDLIQQFDSLPRVGDPDPALSMKIHMSNPDFNKAPIRISLFSDFQCPACKSYSELLPKMIAQYKDSISIQYFFYPLDQNCNPKMTQPLHQYACQAAYLATCLKEDFAKVHDEIFAAQEHLSQEWINDYAKKRNVLECLNKPETKQVVASAMQEGEKFTVAATPTIIMNGIKIAAVPLNNLFIIFDEIIKREKEGKK